MRAVRVIDDVSTLRLMADPTRSAILELLTKPRSVSELARVLDVPRTRLYHHVDLLVGSGLVEQVGERPAGALRERIYASTAVVFRPSARLMRSGSPEERAEVLGTIVLDATRADLRRAVASGDVTLGDDDETVSLGRSIAYVDERRAAEFRAELEALAERFETAHSDEAGRAYAFAWALYPSSHPGATT